MAETSSPPLAVLLVEDETLVRVVASEMLGDEGFQVYEARDGQEALTILEMRGDGIKALVTDIAMPNLSGLDLVAIVSGRWPHLGIVLASAHAPPDLREKMPPGARFLAKPYKASDLAQAVQAAIGENAAPGPAVALHGIPPLQAGRMHGAGGLAQPLPEPES